MNQWTTPLCQAASFKKESVFRVILPSRCRKVLFLRSLWAVSPDSLPTLGWGVAGKDAGIRPPKVAECPASTIGFGILSQSVLQVASLRSPLTKPTICRVLRHKAVHVYFFKICSGMTSFQSLRAWAREMCRCKFA